MARHDQPMLDANLRVIEAFTEKVVGHETRQGRQGDRQCSADEPNFAAPWDQQERT